MASLSKPPKSSQYRLTLGLTGFAKISAIEGVRLSAASRAMFEEFERCSLSAAQRRQAIVAKHAKKA
jgi:hypothetical protein